VAVAGNPIVSSVNFSGTTVTAPMVTDERHGIHKKNDQYGEESETAEPGIGRIMSSEVNYP
jgi:hypothetical protein